jgi:methylated-DNA-protein-cysteine methyltransferase-like protein
MEPYTQQKFISFVEYTPDSKSGLDIEHPFWYSICYTKRMENMTPSAIRQAQRFVSPPKREEFNHKVWVLVRQIPLGKVSTYGKIAALLSPPPGMDAKAYLAFGARWVGGAMAACPQDVPWQRVINSQGKVSLRPGGGGGHQRELLEAEGVIFDDHDRVDLKIYAWEGPSETH